MERESNHFADFGLEPEHVAFREQLRRFIGDRIEPIARVAEARHEFPREVYGELSAQGYLGINFAEEIGGCGGDLLMGCIFYEELTRASAGISAGVFAHQHLATGPILKFGTGAQKSEFAYPAVKGERIGAFALTEPDAGSDIRGIKTRARQVDGGWVINGSKLYITNGAIADFILVAARTGEDRRSDSLTLFVVDARVKGITAAELKKVGNHSSSTAFVSFQDVSVDSESVLGTVGRGLHQLKATLTEGRILVASRGLGIGQEAYEAILRYAGERQAFGQSIGKFQSVAFKVAEMAMRCDAARLMIYRAARLKMAGHDCVREASMAKFMSSELAVGVATSSLLLHGGAGYMEEMKVARLFRDAPEAWIGEGTNEIQLMVIAKSLGLS